MRQEPRRQKPAVGAQKRDLARLRLGRMQKVVPGRRFGRDEVGVSETAPTITVAELSARVARLTASAFPAER